MTAAIVEPLLLLSRSIVMCRSCGSSPPPSPVGFGFRFREHVRDRLLPELMTVSARCLRGLSCQLSSTLLLSLYSVLWMARQYFIILGFSCFLCLVAALLGAAHNATVPYYIPPILLTRPQKSTLPLLHKFIVF